MHFLVDLLVVLAFVAMPVVYCVSEDEANVIAADLAAVVASENGLNYSRLPSPTMARLSGRYVFDYKDSVQNVWIVIVVDCQSGDAEASVDELIPSDGAESEFDRISVRIGEGTGS